jgi:hypothetical protein
VDGGGDWQSNRLISPANVGAKGFRKFGADHFFGLHSWQVRQDFISNRNSYRSLTEVLFARMERLPSVMHDLNWCTAYTATALNSPPFGRFAPVRPLWHLACLCHIVGAIKCLGGHMAKILEFYIPQSFRKVSKWLPPAERGKVLAFPLAVPKSA